MRMLITGGAGSLGSNIIDAYLDRPGVEICVIDNFSTGERGSLPDAPNVQVIEGSVADAALVDRAFEDFRPSAVVHCAASYKDPNDWEGDAATNVLGSINVARSTLKWKAGRLVNFQTALCYGRPDIVPTPEDHPLRPFTSYAISKTAGEQYLLMSGANAVSFRLATVIAPRLAIGPIPTFYQRLKAGKSCFCSATVRDFMDVSDFLRLFDKAIREDGPTGAFNASPGYGVTIRRIFDEVSDYLKIRPETEPPTVPPGNDDVPEVVLSPKRAEAAFGWRVETSFEDMIRKMLAWYDAHGVTAIYSHVRKPADHKS